MSPEELLALLDQCMVEKIYRDPRHRGVITLLQGFSEKRQFEDWEMGFRELNSPEVRGHLGYSEFMNLPLTADAFVKNPSQIERLLNTFRKT